MGVAILILLLFLSIAGGVYYLISDPGLRQFALPYLSKQTGIPLFASRIEWSPFSSLTIHNLRVGDSQEPLLKAKLAKIRYDGNALLNKKLDIESIELQSGGLRLHQYPDGTFRFPPQSESSSAVPSAAPADAVSKETKHWLDSLAIGKLILQDFDVDYSSLRRTVLLRKLNLQVTDFKREGSIGCELDASFTAKETLRPTAQPLQGTFKASIQTQVNQQFIPNLARVRFNLENLKGNLGGELLDPSSLNLDINLTRSEMINLDLSAGFSFKQPARAGSPAQHASGQLKGKAQIHVNEQWMPQTAKIEAGLENLKGSFAGETIDGFGGRLNVDLSITDGGLSVLKRAELTAFKNGATLTSFSATGPMDLAKKTVDLDIQIGPVKSNVLNLLLPSNEISFENTALNYVGHLSVLKNGEMISSFGKVDLSPLNLTSPKMPPGIWKPMVIKAEYALECNLPQKLLHLTKLDVDARAQSRPLMQGALNRPMIISWADPTLTSHQAEDADFTLKIFSLDLPPFTPLLGLPAGNHLTSGTLDSTTRVIATERGHNLILETRTELNKVVYSSPSVSLMRGTFFVDGRIHLKSLQAAQFQNLSIKCLEASRQLARLSLNGNLDLNTKTGSGSLQMDASLASLLLIHPVPGLSVATGNLKGTVDWKLLPHSGAFCHLDLAAGQMDFTCKNIHCRQIGFTLKSDLDWRKPQLKLTRTELNAILDGESAGACKFDFQCDTLKNSWALAYQLQDCKEDLLGAVFDAFLPGRKLKSLELAGKGELKFDDGVLDLKTDAAMKNLMVENSLAPNLKPLNARLSADLQYNTNGHFNLRSATLQLDPTPTAKNLVHLSGTIKETPTLFFADIKAQGQSLDVTPYYDQLFGSVTNKTAVVPAAAPPPSPAPASAPAAPNSAAFVSPRLKAPPLPPPEKDISLLVTIDSLKLGSNHLANVKLPFRMQKGAIELPDTQFKLNNAPVIIKIQPQPNAGKKGFSFEVQTEGLALAPLVDAFAPELKNEIHGNLKAKLTGQGAGTTWDELKPSLDGYLEVLVRDAKLEKIPTVREGLDELGGLLNSDDIKKSSVDFIEGSARIAGEKLHTDNLHIRGSSIELTVCGDLMLDTRLDLKATMKIQRQAMQNSPLLSQVIQPLGFGDQEWAKMPGAATVTGTLADPNVGLDKKKFFGEAFRNAGVNIGMQALEQLLNKGQKTDSTGQTNQGGSGNTKKGDFFDNLFKGIFGK